MNWQPIETAPKDGTEIFGWHRDCGVMMIRWTSCEAFCTDAEMRGMSDEAIHQQDWFCADWAHGDRLEGDLIPTHWMPLPEPPQ